jgi:capsule polysaccharide export protein KpsE/RkpR
MTASVEGTTEVSGKGIIMPENAAPKRIEQLLAEADALIQQVNDDAIKNMKAEHRIKVETHAQHLKKVKAEIQGKVEKKGVSEMGHSAEGMHEAIQEISKAMGELAKYFTRS